MTDINPKELPYRPCVGIMLVNDDNKVFVAQRSDNRASKWRNAWQMPQGGIDDGETAELAALRELEEETSVKAQKEDIIVQSSDEHFYDLPDELIGKLWKGKWRGQRQFWFLIRFRGSDNDININTEHPEFCDWKWSKIDQISDEIVPFKRNIYSALAQEFGEVLNI